MDARRTGTILDEIVAQKMVRLALQKERTFPEKMVGLAKEASEPRNFRGAILRNDAVSLIAEIKKASPSSGLLREEFAPAGLARSYEKAGASAISVITEEDYFLGMSDYLTEAREAAALPVLRKDFIFDPYQVYEARALGADALLLIAAILDEKKLADLRTLTVELDMTALVEVHTEEELKRAIDIGADVVGINSRNLKTMKVDTPSAMRLFGLVPEGVIKVAESGVRTFEDMQRLDSLGVDAALVGEAIVTAADVEDRIRSLLGDRP